MMKTYDAREISARELHKALREQPDLFLLDLRNRDEFARYQIQGPRAVPTLNAPYFEVLAEMEGDDIPQAFADHAAREWADLLPRQGLTVVACAKGSTSALAAEGLRRLGYRAVSLRDGLPAWAEYYDIRTVVAGEALSIYQVSRPARGCLSYVLASGRDAVVVDPLRHADRYLEFAAEKGLRIRAVLDTHGHADHISGGTALAGRLNVPYYLHPYDAIHPIDVLPATVDYEPIRPGQTVQFGSAELTALHIPGHTLGNLAYLVNGQYLLSGDSIFVESIARPDLGGRGETWSPLHYRSLSRLAALPDRTLVLPGHFSSPAEADDQGLYASGLGALKARNEGLIMLAKGEEAFTGYLLQSLPQFPPEYVEIKRVNAGLTHPDEEKASELETGRNICALSQAYSQN